ncbi:MAG: formyltransferase family protein [bacterium]|nr:formyltransferase family protein [bacterium]
MGIVCIVLPGEQQRAFVNALQKATGAVELVIITKPRVSTDGRLQRISAAVRSGAILQELWYGALLRLSSQTRAVLGCLRASGIPSTSPSYDAPVINVDDVNDADTEARLKKLSPALIVLWTPSILRANILATAKKVINYHTGILPYYRGSVANQFAVLRRDARRIGSTIHYVSPGVDRGDIIAQLFVDTNKPPKQAFRELNDASLNLYIDIAKRILAGEDVPGSLQDQAEGGFFRLSDWTNGKRWRLGRQLLRWERTGRF